MNDISLFDNHSLSLEKEYVEDNIKEAGGWTFDEETVVNYMGDMEKINFKEISSEETIRYPFPNVNGEIIQ